ncbi:PREDICTED: crossover junction endonuclease EME1A-like [Camelina sativa]|uniref:Crossover junction endonuclease EME1A-like n=1 Tax=Camelina sativa TaxID=90675 RepID=A0ABM0XTV6_CAMSA|nr:PREDICTED: crossover junction endonuclease EME1A-like [Camelina sativa]
MVISLSIVPQKQPPGSASTTPLFVVDEAPLSDDVTVVKSSSFVSEIGVSSHRESHTFSVDTNIAGAGTADFDGANLTPHVLTILMVPERM